MAQLSPAVAFAVALAACSSEPATSASSKNSVVVFHTATAVMTVHESDIEATRFRQKIDQFYPAACVDRDDDDDGIPNSADHHSRPDDDGDDDDRDGGADDDLQPLRDGGDDESPLEQTRGCSGCNRGPGTAGDFRLELRGNEAQLDRATVGSVDAAGVITVASPDGAIRISVGGGTEVREGQATPGAEIRVEGTFTRDAAGAITIAAARIEVLCAGPTPMPAAEVPAEARAIPALD